jgi:rhamnogalacturonan endolyase
VLADPESDWQDQCLGYIYWTRADTEGHFEFKNVRTGTYALYAFGGSQTHPREENPFNDFKSQSFRILPGKTQTSLGTLAWAAESHGQKLFQIGIPDRSTREFKLGNLRRQFGLWEQTPRTLDYTVPPPEMGEANRAVYEATHWFYLESEDGSKWKIHFPCNQTPKQGQKAWLSLALAGTCLKPQLSAAVNGHHVWESGDTSSVPSVSFGDDSSVRRCAVNGAYHHYVVIPFNASVLKKGPDNIITLSVNIPGKNKIAGGIMYDALKLELEPAE